MLKAATEEQLKHIELLIAGDAPINLISWRRDNYSEPDHVSGFDLDGRVSFDTLAEIVDYLRACNPEKK